MFSSVVIAFVISAFNRIKEFRKKIKRQHYTYLDTLDDFEEILKVFDESETCLYYHPLYNDLCYRIAKEYYNDRIKEFENIRTLNSDFFIAIDGIQARLKCIDHELKSGYLLAEAVC